MGFVATVYFSNNRQTNTGGRSSRSKPA